MKCPIDGATLVISDRNGIEIDYCPTCRGVWLDRGELDKIIERSEAAAPVPQQRYEQLGRKGSKKKEGLGGMLGDIFDF